MAELVLVAVVPLNVWVCVPAVVVSNVLDATSTDAPLDEPSALLLVPPIKWLCAPPLAVVSLNVWVWLATTLFKIGEWLPPPAVPPVVAAVTTRIIESLVMDVAVHPAGGDA